MVADVLYRWVGLVCGVTVIPTKNHQTPLGDCIPDLWVPTRILKMQLLLVLYYNKYLKSNDSWNYDKMDDFIKSFAEAFGYVSNFTLSQTLFKLKRYKLKQPCTHGYSFRETMFFKEMRPRVRNSTCLFLNPWCIFFVCKSTSTRKGLKNLHICNRYQNVKLAGDRSPRQINYQITQKLE